MEEQKKQKPTGKGSDQDFVKEKHKIILETAAVTLAVMLVAIGIFFAWKKIHESADKVSQLQDQLDQMQNDPGKVQVTGEPGDDSSQPESTGGDIFSDVLSSGSSSGAQPAKISEYEGWKTYTNYEVGYSLRYPADWDVKETNTVSELFNEPVKYIALYSPGKKYILHWGLRSDDDNFRISERTGIGVGEDKKDGTVNILGTTIAATRHVDGGKAVEIFYPSAGTADVADGNWEIVAAFDSDNGERDLTNAPERKKAELILESVRFIARDQSNACNESFSKEEILNMEGWKRFDNQEKKFTFLYPQEWDVKVADPDAVANANMSFQFRWGRLAEDNLENYVIDRVESMKIDCLTAKLSYISVAPGDIHAARDHAVVAQFEKDGNKYMVVYVYIDQGASLVSDQIEQFKTILKTVNFS